MGKVYIIRVMLNLSYLESRVVDFLTSLKSLSLETRAVVTNSYKLRIF
jgi:hypothetical protein